MSKPSAVKLRYDLQLAESFKRMHPVYNKENVRIREVWREDKVLCVRYETIEGREIGWFHYLFENGQLTWW